MYAKGVMKCPCCNSKLEFIIEDDLSVKAKIIEG